MRGASLACPPSASLHKAGAVAVDQRSCDPPIGPPSGSTLRSHHRLKNRPPDHTNGGRFLKIALVSDGFSPRRGGIEMHVADLANRLATAGHEVHVITATPGPRHREPYRVHRLKPLSTRNPFVASRAEFRKMDQLLRQERFDVVHCHGSVFSPTAYGGLFLAQRMNTPALITWASFLGPYRWFLRLADLWWGWSRWRVLFSAVSGEVARDIRSVIRRQEVHRLPNGLEVEWWRSPRIERIGDELHVVSVMRLHRKKRAKALIRLIPALKRVMPDGVALKVTIVGDGSLRRQLERIIIRKRLGNTVTLLGHRTRHEIRQIYAHADVYVQPTVWEAFGLAALEARCAGLPVAARAQSGILEFIEPGTEGLFARTDGELAGHLARLAQDRPLRHAMTQRNRECAPAVGWTDVLSRHLHLYAEAIRVAAATPLFEA